MIVRRLGIGLPYLASLPPEVYRSGTLDFVEITPEELCRARRGPPTSIELVDEQFDRCRETCGSLPIVLHGVELSIGSAAGWNESYLDLVDRFQAAWPFVWHSEHLSFQTVAGEDGGTLDTGIPLPVPPTEESADLVAERSARILARYGVPFLLENPAHYLATLPSDSTITDEFGLMRAITGRSGCFQLLDLHNIYCNSMNHGFDAFAAVDRMPLDRVIEIHVAGGSSHDGFWLDAHDGRTPERVWELLEYTLPRTPNVAGVVFELLEDHVPRVGPGVILQELATAGTIWAECGLG